MVIKQHFRDGKVAQRIVKSLQKLPAQQIAELCKEKKLTYYKPENELSYFNLRFNGLDDYCALTGCNLSYYLWGTMTPPPPQYTDRDEEILELLNQLNDTQIEWLLNCFLRICKTPITKLFHNLDNEEFYNLYKEDTASIRIRHLLFSWSGQSESGRSSSSKHLGEEHDSGDKEYIYGLNAVEDIISTIFVFRRDRVYTIPTDHLPDLATWLGVSVHWFCGSKKQTIYCNSYLGDLAFDLFTICRSYHRSFFIELAEMARNR